jgi:hypothetical protein
MGKMKVIGNLLVAAGASVLIAGCGGGGGSAPAESPTGILNIAITDAPVDVVSKVNVQFTGVTLKPASGDEIEIVFDTPKDIDLLTLTDGATADLLPDTEVPTGLAVNAKFDNDFDSYAMTPTGQMELQIPSGSETGLKLVSGFTVTANQSTNLIIDWDLRRALSDPIGQAGLHSRFASSTRITRNRHGCVWHIERYGCRDAGNGRELQQRSCSTDGQCRLYLQRHDRYAG